MPKAFQFKITLKGIKPPIWRRFLVSDQLNFDEFHEVIQTVMGWYNSHLYEFEMGHLSLGIPHADYGGTMDDSRKVTLGDYFDGIGETINYVYDFGDDWEHQIKLEKILQLDDQLLIPICIKGKRNCPLEDSGGPYGYQDMLIAVNDKNHEDHLDMKDWVPEDFDPEDFDLNLINKRLSKIKASKK